MHLLDKANNVSVIDHDAGLIAWRGLEPIEKCPECDNFSLSEIVLCKGSNILAHKGRWYQIVHDIYIFYLLYIKSHY